MEKKLCEFKESDQSLPFDFSLNVFTEKIVNLLY